ncbi:MAG: hypothetical protein H0S84_07045 [Bacteroidales bacterium]|jgi:hypothetical protein|nr:hypothetical protein [Bacteroidales bacterium]
MSDKSNFTKPGNLVIVRESSLLDSLTLVRHYIDDLFSFYSKHKNLEKVNLRTPESLIEKIVYELKQAGKDLEESFKIKENRYEKLILLAEDKKLFDALIEKTDKLNELVCDYPIEHKRVILKIEDSLKLHRDSFLPLLQRDLSLPSKPLKQSAVVIKSVTEITVPLYEFYLEQGFEEFQNSFFDGNMFPDLEIENKGDAEVLFRFNADFLSRVVSESELQHVLSKQERDHNDFEYVIGDYKTYKSLRFKFRLTDVISGKEDELILNLLNEINPIIENAKNSSEIDLFFRKLVNQINALKKSVSELKNQEGAIFKSLNELINKLYEAIKQRHQGLFDDKILLISDKSSSIPLNLTKEIAEKLFQGYYNALIDLDYISVSNYDEFKDILSSSKSLKSRITWKVLSKTRDLPNYRLLLTVLHFFSKYGLIDPGHLSNVKQVNEYLSSRFINYDNTKSYIAKSSFSDWKSELFKKHNGDLKSFCVSGKNLEFKNLFVAFDKVFNEIKG